MALQLQAPGLTSQTTKTTCGSELFSHARLPTQLEKPVLVLIHGFPNTNYLWRKVIQHLPANQPIFIPDMPGYGESTPSSAGSDKRTVGYAILEALSKLLKHSPRPIPVVLAGHDRGARVCHRLATDFAWPAAIGRDTPIASILQEFELKGTACIDTVPEIEQWASFEHGRVAKSTFHWPFLANVEMATAMISAYGAAKWCKKMCIRWAGLKEQIETESAQEVYAQAFSKPENLRAACMDYECGAGIDFERQVKDQKEGRKFKGPFLAMWSATYLGSRFNCPEIWGRYMADGGESGVFVPVGEKAGHFLPEEAPVSLAENLTKLIG
ncbi:alpha/beta-hydrolase [Pseudovirgaria hyperparasitica]|uniref:Alpha/beta-hydrolase n=1 Tax=Pseudovirgaria hyperparasitica TaxID=470096 RepID=A0A6A6W7R7_9PEZI|nr:alpha/beta-hydrolase [Pseudovirgaria hyperparasitica]KAF2758249.1 alpha/beta-hydrolase [Pseudovirgaria hyperparasitica]